MIQDRATKRNNGFTFQYLFYCSNTSSLTPTITFLRKLYLCPQVAAKKNMDIIQAKLQECINKGSTNSIGRLSNLLHGNSSDDPDDDGNTDSKNMNVSMDTTNEVVTTPASSQSGKDPDKIPHKASITSNRKKKK